MIIRKRNRQRWVGLFLVAVLGVTLCGCGESLDSTSPATELNQNLTTLTDEIITLEGKIDSLEEQIGVLESKLDTLQGGAIAGSDNTQSGEAYAGNGDSSTGSGSGETAENPISGERVDLGSANLVQGTGQNFRQEHGALAVNGGSLVDQNGDPIQLYGMSTHGINWFPGYVDEAGFRSLRDDWGANCVRIAMYTSEYNGYCAGGNQGELKNIVRNGINHATNLGMYVIIDWHILTDQSPVVYQDQAISFFEEFSASYGGYTNVLYEICNEPNGYATWQDVKNYANAVIPVIRKNDPDAVIIVGTPTWCQEIDKALADPLPYENILYAFHFYASTHGDDLRQRVGECAEAGLPIFVSEFGTCEASGNGNVDLNACKTWLQLLDRYGISYLNWSLCNKGESASAISSSCSKTSGWSEGELTESGKFIRNWYRDKSF